MGCSCVLESRANYISIVDRATLMTCFKYLSYRDLTVAVMLVNQSWHNSILDDKTFWEELFLRDTPTVVHHAIEQVLIDSQGDPVLASRIRSSSRCRDAGDIEAGDREVIVWFRLHPSKISTCNIRLVDMVKRADLLGVVAVANRCLQEQSNKSYSILKDELCALTHVNLNIDEGGSLSISNEVLNSVQCAAANGHVGILQVLLDLGAPVDGPSSEDVTPLHVATICGREAAALMLLDHGASVSAVDKRCHRTALHWAAREGLIVVVHRLLQSGANVNAVDAHGHTPIRQAAFNGHLNVIRFLVQHGANVLVKDKVFEDTEFKVACGNGHLPVVQYLLGLGAPVNYKNSYGHTALHAAAFGGHLAVVLCLLDRGAFVNETNKGGRTALNWASTFGHQDVVQLLTDRGGT